MKKRKSLERAVILGLLLSTSVYGSAWAEIDGQFMFNHDEDSYELSENGYFSLNYSSQNNNIGLKPDGTGGESDKYNFEYGVLVSSTNSNENQSYDTTFDWKLKSLNINITKLADGSEDIANNYYIAGVMVDGFDDEKTANLILTTTDRINVKVNSQNNYAAVGVWAQSDDSITLNSKNGSVIVDVTKTAGSNLSYKDGGEEDRTLHAVYGLNASNDRNSVSYDPNDESYGSEIKITTDNGSIIVTVKNESSDLNNSHVYAAANDNGHLILNSGQGTDYDGTGSISLIAESNENNNVYGLDTWAGEENILTADKIHLFAKAESGVAYGLKVSGGADENKFNADRNEIIGVSEYGNAYGIWADGDSRVDVTGKDNFISGTVIENPKSGTGIMVDNSEAVIDGNNNYINAVVSDEGNVVYLGMAEGLAIDANNASTVVVNGNESNTFGGAVYANGISTNVNIKGKDIPVTNNFYSASVIKGAGDLDENSEIKQVISALYAEEGAQINLSGNNIIQTYYGNPKDEETSERVVWAYDTADITINGTTNISTTLYGESPNNKDIAIAAGSATGLNPGIVGEPVDDRATVTLNYGEGSSITGDILAAYAGEVNIQAGAVTARAASGTGINITGNLLAGNNGILNVDLGNGGVLNGRADDYGDAGVVTNGHGSEYFNPAFSSTVYSGGQVNLTMGDNSRWNVTGQSWITSIKTSDAEETAENNHIIDLVHTNTDLNNKAHALTVYEFDGNATFNMSLAADRDVSDMLYIKNADGSYVVNVANAVTYDDMYADRGDGNVFDGLRFATVGEGSNATFRAITYDGGINNVEYLVDTDSYDGNEENEHYNGNDLNEYKPGDNTIDEFFKNEGTPGADVTTNSIMMLAAEDDAAADGTVDSVTGANEVTNFKLVGVKSTDLSDGGKTVLNMSRANYSNAIYMDRLNKRLGEARYINGEEDQGMWVRIRHDRIGKTDAYRSQNTMYELGYDEKQECDNGMRRVGFAIDYMHGDTGYNDIAGKGEIDRYGLWLYDTWMGDKGHYADYVAKWGHLKNDFGIYAPTTGEEITGDYSNNVFSISAEYGRKKDIGNDWYFEPQAQLQLARVTGADYVTSQGTKVSVDGINSLIGRAGFRLGKDFGEEKLSTVYIKADVMHEFLGDQDIKALDATTNGNWSTISYENEGTWYDVGIGFAAMMSKNSYAFLDLEKSFGHDNDETYQINAGMQWTF